MSNNETFIDEVTEAVRSDRLFRYFRRYGWIAALAVVGLVGAAAYVEWTAAKARVQAESAGDALLDALETEDPAARAAAFAALQTTGDARAVAQLLAAAEAEQNDDPETAAAILQALALDPDLPEIYRDLAALKAVMLQAPVLEPAALQEALAPLAAPGMPFRLLAQEQIAHAQLAAGDAAAAIATLRAITEDADVTTTQGLRDRALGLMVALGADTETQPASN